jgi:putative intracellular protease/amidase
MKILMVMTSHDQLGDTGKKTGVWLEEFAAPYFVFHDEGAAITLASPKGGRPPIDPRSEAPEAQTAATLRFREDKAAQAAFAETIRLQDATAETYHAVFYPGGHGPLWDLAHDPVSIDLIEVMWLESRFVAAVCHGPAVFRRTRRPDGAPLVKGRSVTGFSNAEEEAIGLARVVPFLVEDTLEQNGGAYSRAENWHPYVVVDDNLLTGQNPASAEPAAKELLHQMALREIRRMPAESKPLPPPV